MKRRIIGMLLVVVMLVSALVSCGYSYSKEDVSKYVKFEKKAFSDFIAEIEIVDGDFTADEETREKKVWDSIYTSLATFSDGEKKTEGAAGAHDVIFYCYYATLTEGGEGGKTHVFFADQMSQSAADKNKFQLGLSTTEDLNKLIEEKIGEFNFTDSAYSTKTAGKSAKDDVAYISYTVTPKAAEGEEAKPVSYKYEKVILGAEDNALAKVLAGANIGEAFKYKAEGEEEAKAEFVLGDKTYSNVKINWVVEGGEPITVKYTPYDSDTSKDDVSGTSVQLEDKELTYYVYPVYYNEVADYSGDEVLKNLISSITVDSLPSFKDKEEGIKALNDLKTALKTAETELETAEKAVTDAQNTLKDVQKEDPSDAEQESIDAAEEILEEKEKARDQRIKDRDAAQKNLNDGIEDFYEDVASKKTVEEEYEESVYDGLLEKYHTDIKEKLAKAIWEEMLIIADMSNHPSDKAIKPVYDMMMEALEYDFYEGKNSAGQSNYSVYGSFARYLNAKKIDNPDGNVQDAKDKVWGEAEQYVYEIFVVYYVAELYGQKITKEDMEAYKQELDDQYSGYYEDMVEYYGKGNVEASVQFDKLMDYLLDWETDDDEVVYKDGKIKFKNIGYKIAE